MTKLSLGSAQREYLYDFDSQAFSSIRILRTCHGSIAGGGPCGLTTALTLQKHGVPFVIYERASRQKLCSNAGSGIDVSLSRSTF